MFDNSINNLIDEKYCDLTSQPERTVNSLVEVKRSGSICNTYEDKQYYIQIY